MYDHIWDRGLTNEVTEDRLDIELSVSLGATELVTESNVLFLFIFLLSLVHPSCPCSSSFSNVSCPTCPGCLPREAVFREVVFRVGENPFFILGEVGVGGVKVDMIRNSDSDKQS